MYRIQCRIVSYDPKTMNIKHPGFWQNYTKKYKTIGALMDALKWWKERKWQHTWANSEGIIIEICKWEWRPVHAE